MQHERALTVAAELAKKLHNLKSFESNMTGIVGMQSSAQVVVQDLQKAAGELVFALRSNRPQAELQEKLYAVRGGIHTVQALGLLSDELIESYEVLAHELYDLIDTGA